MIYSLQVLRAYAAISVMIGHAALEAATNYGVSLPFDEFPLIAGVDIFFIISGFIVYYTSSNYFDTPGGIRKFAIKRFIRIVPLYWVMTTAMLAALLFLGGQVRSTELEWSNVVGSYLFFPVERSGGRIAPILSLGWTLNYEIFFYVIFGIALAFSRIKGVGLILLTLALFIYLGSAFGEEIAALRFWGNTIILEFAMGLLLAVFYPRIKNNQSLLISIVLLVFGVFLLFYASVNYFHDYERFLKGGVPAFVIVASALFFPVKHSLKIPNLLLVLGASSYALYLSHRFVLRLLSMGFSKLTSMQGMDAVLIYTCFATVLSLIVGYLVYALLEQPLINVFRSRLDNSKGK